MVFHLITFLKTTILRMANPLEWRCNVELKTEEKRKLAVDINLCRQSNLVPFPNTITLSIDGRCDAMICLSNQEIAFIVEQFAKGVR